jgi:hypothetical protein
MFLFRSMDDAPLQSDGTSAPQACACEGCAAMSQRVAHQLAVLRELTELGMRMARALCDEVEAAPRDEAPSRRSADPALMFSRISRAVRQTLALEARILEEARTAEGQRTDPAAERKAEAIARYKSARTAAAIRKMNVNEAVETLIDLEAPDEAGAERLFERFESLMDPADDARFADAPISEWIAAICADLGLTPDWSLWASEDWAAEEAVTRPDSPFAKLGPQDPPPGRSPDWGVRSGGPLQAGRMRSTTICRSPRQTPAGPEGAEAHEPPSG